MCGRYVITTPLEALRAVFGFAGSPVNLAPRWNAAPTQTLPIIRREGAEKRLAMLRWGLVPAWSKQIGGSAPLINARSETVAEKPSFRSAFRSRRCLVPADGFYEWQTLGEGRPKHPFLFARRDGQPFAFAGLWERWQGPDAVVESFCILTTTANAIMAAYHDRFPVILAPGAYDEWLDPARDAKPLFAPAPSEWFTVVPVSPRVNAVRHDDPSCLQPLDRAEPTPHQKSLF